MLQGRLTLLVAAVAIALAACGEEARPIEQLQRTGVTAINESEALACGADASALRAALDIYEIREGEPAPDEATLVAEQYLREESQLWDIRDGRLVPADPVCGDVPATVPTQEIVTEDRPATEIDEFVDQVATMTPADVLANATPEEIAEVGGRECASEIAEVGLAYARWATDRGADPTSLTQLVDDGYLEPLELWFVGDVALEAVPGTPCRGPFEMLPSFDDACRTVARTLEVAREAYFAKFPDATEPTQQDLVDGGLLREVSDRVDLVDGDVAAVSGGVCEGVDLRDFSAPAAADADSCATDRKTLEVAIEAYVAQFDRLPQNERELVDAEMIREPFDSYDIVDGEIVPGDGSACP